MWIRFAQYKRGRWSSERSIRYIVWIYEWLEGIAGRNGWTMIGDGKDCASENVNVELIYNLSDVLEKYYPLALWKGVGYDLPPFFHGIMLEVCSHLTPSLVDTVVFLNGPQLLDVINQDQIPAWKLKTWTTPKP